MAQKWTLGVGITNCYNSVTPASNDLPCSQGLSIFTRCDNTMADIHQIEKDKTLLCLPITVSLNRKLQFYPLLGARKSAQLLSQCSVRCTAYGFDQGFIVSAACGEVISTDTLHRTVCI